MKKNILCIDDIKTNLFTIASVIESADENRYKVFLAQSAHEGLNILIKEKIDLILLDVMMPDIDGFECAKIIRSNKKTKNIPIIFVTANNDDKTIENCFNVGCSDYVNKPFNHVELMARISFHIKLFQREVDAKQREIELSLEANYDSLTKIYNRKMFENIIKTKMDNQNRPLVLIMIDIDYFKRVNDTYGHLVGDDVLKAITILIKKHIRADDLFARWGGEEFILSLDVNINEGVKITDTLRSFIEKEKFDVINSLTCSFGITQFKANDTLAKMIKRADIALYRAKQSGRNRVCKEI